MLEQVKDAVLARAVHAPRFVAAGIWGIAMYWLAGYIYTKQGVGLLRKELGEKYGA